MPGPIREYPLDRCDQFLAKCKSSRNAIKVFATGDSWLAAPGGWWKGASVVNLLNDDDWVRAIEPTHPGFNILSIAKVGFEIDKMPTDHDLIALDYVRNQFASQQIPFAFDAFMVSAGGNDFIPKIATFVDGGGGSAAVDDVALDKIFAMIRLRWSELLMRLAPGQAPVLTNGYGPIIPTLQPGPTWLPVLNVGPWVGPWLLTHCGLDEAGAQALAGEVIDRFNALLPTINGVRYFDLRPTVAAMPASMWHDEIHFVAQGWDLIARQWLIALDAAVVRPARLGQAARALRLPSAAAPEAARVRKKNAARNKSKVPASRNAHRRSRSRAKR
jgi:hypothetical protein